MIPVDGNALVRIAALAFSVKTFWKETNEI